MWAFEQTEDGKRIHSSSLHSNFHQRNGFLGWQNRRGDRFIVWFWMVRWFARSLAGWQEWDMCMYVVRRMRCFISLFFNVSWFLYFHFNSLQFNSNSTDLFIRLVLPFTPSLFSRWYLHIVPDTAATAKSNSRKNTIIVNDTNILVNSIELPFPLCLYHPLCLCCPIVHWIR